MDKTVFRHFALRLDMQNKLEFYGRVREMVRKHKRKMEERLIEDMGKLYDTYGKLYGVSIITKEA